MLSYAFTFANETLLLVISSFFLMLIFAAVVYFDFRYLIIPDWINAGLLLSGLVLSAVIGFESLLYALVLAVSIAVFFYCVAFVYAKFRKREGLGMGDVKFLAAASTWVGITDLPWLLLFASAAALVHALFLGIGGGKIDGTTRLPFGPHLAMGLLLVWHFQKTNLLNGVI